MEKEKLKTNQKKQTNPEDKIINNQEDVSETDKNKVEETDKENKQLSPEEEIEKLKDKLTRTFAEMENQRRRFEKEKDDAFDYGGFAFAREALSLIDNLVRSKVSLENDEKLKNKILFEASGEVNENNIEEYSKTGVDVVSIGLITHSSKAVDMSLQVR